MTRIRVPRDGGNTSSGRTTPVRDTQDIPRATTEGSELPFIFSGSASTTSHEEFNFRTPSISLSPPPSSGRETRQYTLSTGQYNNQHERSTTPTSSEITAGISQLHVAEEGPLSNLNALAAAIEADSRPKSSENPGDTLDVSTPPLGGTHSQSPAASPRRRRSSSRLEIPPHSVSDEPPPADVFNSPGFQKALRDTEVLVRNLVTVLKTSPLHQEAGSTMAKFYDVAVRLSKFPQSANRIVGFVGDAGKGKSSVLNSLLDMDGLVRSSNSGEACTCVATEFHYHDSDTFNIEVDLLDKTELLNQLMELLQFYRYFHQNEMESDEQARYIGKQATLAEDTFFSMFHSHMPSHEALLSKSENELRHIFKTLIAELRPSESRTSKFGLSQEACANELMQLSSMALSSPEAPATAATAWPFIKKIRVFSNAYILSKGLVLVDLPGLRDMNSARRNITELYVRGCDEIFAVSHIGRAVDDEGVQGIFKMAENLEKISIICTKSDDIDAKEAVKDWRGERSERIKRMQNTISNNLREVERLEAELQDFPDLDELTPEETTEWAHFKSQKDRAEKIWKQHKSELQAFLIRTRNADITRKLREKHIARTAGNVVEVFCVSNKIYREKRQLSGDVSLPFLQLSGILDLRRYCVSIVSANQHRVACTFMQKDVPKLLGDIELWLQSGADTLDAEQRQAATRTLSKLRTQLTKGFLDSTSTLRGVSRTLHQCFLDQVYDRATLGQRVSRWSVAAGEAADIWHEWNPQTYIAFCRNYGNHYTKAQGGHDWNAEANDQMVRDLKIPWYQLQEYFKRQQRDVEASIKEMTASAVTYLERESRRDFSRVSTLRQSLIFQQQSLLHNLEAAYDDTEKELRKLGTNLLSSLRTSYIGLEMESSYRDCNLEGGGGSDGRRKRLIEASFGSDELFTTIMAKLRDAFKGVADAVEESITKAINLYLSQVQEIVDLVLSENTAIESQRDPEYHDRVGTGLRTAKDRMQAIQDAIPA